MQVIPFFARLILCLLPLSLTPLWGYLISDSYLNFGGGEKDLFLLIPWIIWSFIYLLIFIISWIKGKGLKMILFFSAGGATGILILAGAVLFLWFNDILGVRR